MRGSYVRSVAVALGLVTALGTAAVSVSAAPAKTAGATEPCGADRPTAQCLSRGFFATLYGGNQVSSTGEGDAGDRNGVGWAVVALARRNTVCWSVMTANINAPVAAHIHRGRAGTNGPVVVPFESEEDGIFQGCANDVDATLIAQIRNNPGNFYVNVHTADFPGGAVRGQLGN